MTATAENFLGMATTSPEVTLRYQILKVASFNLAEPRLPPDPDSLPVLRRWASDLLAKADLALLQEVRSAEHADFLATESGLIHRHHDADSYTDVAVLSRYPLSEKNKHAIPRGKIIDVVADVNGVPNRVVATHFHHFWKPPWEAPPERLDSASAVRQLLFGEQRPLIFGGDLNACPPASASDPSVCNGNNAPGTEVSLLNFLIDSYNVAVGAQHCGHQRIDFIFFGGPYAVENYITPCGPAVEPSDHAFVFVTLVRISS